MEKVYLLLRNNQQNGPYTYEELLQQQLLPTDLIWVEGKSTAWIYPSELTSLQRDRGTTKLNRPDATQPTNRSRGAAQPDIPWYQKRKSPEAELEERAQALRERAQSAAASHSYRPLAPTAHTPQRKYTVYQEEESPILLEVHTLHKKNVSLPQLIAAGVITALVATGWYNREMLTIVRSQQTEVSQAAAPVTFQVSLPVRPKPASVAVVDTVQTRDSVETTPAAMAVTMLPVKPVRAEVKEAASTNETAVATPPQVTPPASEKKAEPGTDTTASTAKTEKKDTAEVATTQANQEDEAAQSATHKKKGLGQALKNIFKKKKKDDDTSADEKEVGQ